MNNSRTISPFEAPPAVVREVGWGASIAAALLRGWRLGCGLPRALLRVSILGLILAIAFVDAARIRLTTSPTAAALARNRTAWLHRWSVLACSVLGLQIERQGYVPVSGLVILNHMSLIDALLLSSVAPFVFVVDMSVRRRPVIGCLARLAGALFRDRQRYRDVARVNFVIARALKRRQLVVLFRFSEWCSKPVANGFPSALLQPAAAARCSLTATAIRRQGGSTVKGTARPEPRQTGIDMLMQPHSLVTIAFHPPTFHRGDRKQLAEQVWREVQALK